MRRYAWLLAGLLGAMWPLWASEVTLTGRVVDENDAGVGAARISFRPAGEPETPRNNLLAFAGPTGAFTVRLPGPGAYLVSAEHDGFFPLKNYALQVGEGPQEIHLTLNHVREVFQSVKVTASPSPIDFDRTSAEQKLSSVEIMNVPYTTTRDLRSAIRMLPGVMQGPNGALHFDGGTENQVLFTLDGFNISDPLSGAFNTKLSVEAVRSLEFTSGRYSPEFGKGSSGALAIQTDLGTDQWHYSGTNFVPGVDTQKGLHIGTWGPRFNFSGPLVKGRAWFSDNIDGEYSTFVVPDLPKGQDRTHTYRADNLLHNQFNLTPSNILFTDFLVNYNNQPGSGLSALDPHSTTLDRRSRTWFFSAKDQIYLARGTLLEVGFGEDRTVSRQIPQGDALYVITPSAKSGNYFVDSLQNSRRDQLLANLYLPSFHLAGPHQLKTGIDLDRLSYSQDTSRTGFQQIGLAGYLLHKTTFSGNGDFSRPSLEASSYLLDAWHLKPNLLIEGGVRQDWDELVRKAALSPRVSVSYAPFGMKNTKISGGYAVVYDATSLQLFTQPLDQYSITTNYNPDGSVAGIPGITVYTIRNPNLKPPRYQNWSAGLEQQLPHSIDLRINLLRKRGHDGFTYVNTLTANNPPPPDLAALYHTTNFDGIFNLENLRRDVYDSGEIAVHQSLGEQYEWMASYTRSRTLSNAVVTFSIDQPFSLTNNVGPMPWDAPNRLVSWGYLPTPRKNWALAYLLDTRTGFPYSVQNEDGSIVGAVNSHRYPNYFSLNLHLERRFRLHGYRLALRGGFNNITNHQNPTVVNNTIGSPIFLHYFGSEGRHFVFRIRWLGKEENGQSK